MATGIHPALSFANIYPASKNRQKKLEDLGKKYEENGKWAFIILKRFLDDIFKIFKGTSKDLHNLFEEMNQIHPSLKFTLAHTIPGEELEEDKCDCNKEASLPFLETLLSIKKNGRIEVDLHKERNR